MQRFNSLSEIASRLPARPTLVLHSACAEPRFLASQLAAQSAHFDGAKLYCLMPMGATPYVDPPASEHLGITTFFPGKGLRAAVSDGRATTLRHPLSAIPALFDRGEIRADAVLLQVSPPDHSGRVSLGLAVDYMPAVLRQRPLVIAQINPRMPRTCGATLIETSSIDYFVDLDEPLQEMAPPAAGDAADERIAAGVASLIEDGSVLQVGIGTVPDLVLGRLGDRRDLGIHSGVITDAVRPLIEAGVINNTTKQMLRGVSVTTMAAGAQTFYDFLNRNTAIEFHPSSLTHGARTLERLSALTAINSALQIDLAGCVNAESMGGRIVAAPGGLADFACAASRAPRGKSILALRASVRDRTNIVARLPAQAPVSVAGQFIDYVVTEFGVATLRGRAATQRAEALIAVAHPNHQPALERELSLGIAGSAAGRPDP